MPKMLNISEAASLALHAMVLLAAHPEQRLAAGEIASELQASEAHLSKVLQRLARAGLVSSARGPKGGFVLRRKREEITLLEVFEAVDGPFPAGKCLLGLTACPATRCILGGVVEAVNQRVRSYLARTRLSKLSDVFA